MSTMRIRQFINRDKLFISYFAVSFNCPNYCLGGSIHITSELIYILKNKSAVLVSYI